MRRHGLMLGETRESEDARERHALWRDLLVIAMPPRMIRFRFDVAQRELDRIVAGPPPKVSKWNPYAARQKLAYMMWRCFTLLQKQRRRLASESAA